MIYLLITTLIWAFSFGLIGTTLQGLDPILIAALRLVIALLIFLPLLRSKRIPPVERFHLTAIGAVQFGTMYICYLSAFQFIPSHLVALFSILTPIYVVVFHDIRRRKFHLRYLLAAGLSVFGACIIKAEHGELNNVLIGFALMQVSGIAFAFGQVAYRDWKREHKTLKDHEVFGYLYAGGATVALMATLLTVHQPEQLFDASPKQLAAILYLGVVASGLGFFLWNKGASLSSPGALAAFNNAVVPVAVFVSLFVFGEIEATTTVDLVRLATGGSLIGLAVFLGKSAHLPNTDRIE